MSGFKLDQCTDKPQNLFTFCFDNLKICLILTFEIDLPISFKVYKFFYVVIKGKLAHWPSGWSACQGSGRPGFNPRLRHTKDFRYGT